MKFTLILLLAMNAYGLSNCVSITEATGTTQSNRPTIIHRWFARGEIADYPQPFISGSGLSIWQTDVKSRWDDGSVRVAYVSWRQTITANSTIEVCFQSNVNRSSAGNDATTSSSALSQAQMIAFDTGSVIKVDDEWMLVNTIGCNGCAGYDNRYNTPGAVYITFNITKRGLWGTTAVSHTIGAPVFFHRIYLPENTTGGYAFIALGGLALATNTQGTYSSGLKAYELMKTLVQGQHYFAIDTNSPMWAFVPRRDPANVRAVAGTGTLTLRYNAPDRAACKYTVAASLPDSSDLGIRVIVVVQSHEQ